MSSKPQAQHAESPRSMGAARAHLLTVHPTLHSSSPILGQPWEERPWQAFPQPEKVRGAPAHPSGQGPRGALVQGTEAGLAQGGWRWGHSCMAPDVGTSKRESLSMVPPSITSGF